jgi:hypothetical protein
MPDLIHSLQSSDLGHLRIIASFWGLELSSPEPRTALQELSSAMLDAQLMLEIIEALPLDAKNTLEALLLEKGRIPWLDFTRRFGELRQAGPGRRDREKIYQNPVSPVEVLYFRGLIGRAFFETKTGLLEFAYIPDDLIPHIPVEQRTAPLQLGRIAAPGERKYTQPAGDKILDDACTLLASLRMGWNSLPDGTTLSIPGKLLMGILHSAGMLDGVGDEVSNPGLHLERIKEFLEADRSEALLLLVRSWLETDQFNELRLLPDLVCEGVWENDPKKARQYLIRKLKAIPAGKWWNLTAFIASIRDSNPEFLRTAGEFNSWLIRRQQDGSFLHGFQHWDDVEGELIRFIISVPMYWLGLTDLSMAEEDGAVTAFRLSKRGLDMLEGHVPAQSHPEDGLLHVSSNGRITVPEYFPRPVRYLVSRCSEWEKEGQTDFRYRLTPASLKKAQEQGIRVSQLLSILNKYKAAAIPPSFSRAMNRWEINGTEARLEAPIILRLSRPEVLDELRKSKAGRFLGEILGSTTVVVKQGAREKVVAALGELGILTDIKTDIIIDGEKHHK